MKYPNGAKLLYGLNIENRKKLMLAMRDADVNDSQIGKVIGISRERVAQSLGRRDREAIEEERHKTRLEKAKPMVEQGLSLAKIASGVGCSRSTIESLITELMPFGAYLKLKRKRQVDVVAKELMEFVTKSHLPLTQYYLQIWDNNLNARALRVMKIPQWRKYLGLETELFTRKPSVAREDVS